MNTIANTAHIRAPLDGVPVRDAQAVERLGAGDGRQQRFVDIMGLSANRAPSSDIDAKQQAREAAERFVSKALVEPILAQMREMTMMAEGPFKPGSGEKTFTPMFDAYLSGEIVRSQNFPIVDRLAAELHKNAAGLTAAQSKLAQAREGLAAGAGSENIDLNSVIVR